MFFHNQKGGLVQGEYGKENRLACQIPISARNGSLEQADQYLLQKSILTLKCTFWVKMAVFRAISFVFWFIWFSEYILALWSSFIILLCFVQSFYSCWFLV